MLSAEPETEKVEQEVECHAPFARSTTIQAIALSFDVIWKTLQQEGDQMLLSIQVSAISMYQTRYPWQTASVGLLLLELATA